MVAFQLAGKATRDALYLSTFGVDSLPRMVLAGALVSALLTLALSRVMQRLGPGRLVPALFLASALLLGVEWSLLDRARPLVTVVFYLHFSGLGALVVSGFWAMVTERFDPRSARLTIGRIATGASIGGLLGGLIPGQLGPLLPLRAMLLLLALMHLVAAVLTRAIRTPSAPGAAPRGEVAPAESARRAFASSPYLRWLALLVVLTAMTEGLLDWVFKVRVTGAAPSGEQLLRLFSLFYTVTALLGILLQATVLRSALATLGIARSAALLPAGVSLGAAAGLLLPGLGPMLLARGTEIVLRNSIFRSAYELLFSPVPPAERRSTKLLVDVGATRLGDIAGAGLIQLVLLLAVARPAGLILAAAIATALLTLYVARRLHLGYAGALARSLAVRADEVPAAHPEESSALLQTIGGFDLQTLYAAPIAGRPSGAGAPVGAIPHDERDQALRSGEPDVVIAALGAGALPAKLVSRAIQLLAWDEVAPAAIEALGIVASREVCTLARALGEPDEDFAIRRRLVLVLARAATPESVEALLLALADRRFEVRYRAGRALRRIFRDRPDLPLERSRILDVVLREVAVGRGVWESRRLIDETEEDDDDMALVRERADRSLEHVFTLLGLVLPPEPIRLAYLGLFSNDRNLRGTALEYLESVLPPAVRERLWGFLEPGASAPKGSVRDADAALAQLLESRASIVIALEDARRRAAAPLPPDA